MVYAVFAAPSVYLTHTSIMQKEAIKLHRPYFSREELERIHKALLSEAIPDSVLVRKVRNFNEEIDLKLRKSNYSTSTRVTESDRVSAVGLGFDDPGTNKIKQTIHKIDGEAASFKLENAPETCSPQEIDLALEYRFENNLMTPKEDYEYQQKMGWSFSTMTYEESLKYDDKGNFIG